MKALSLWQPWATLKAIDAKRIETRHWSTTHRGQLAIHAAKRWNRELAGLCNVEPFLTALKAVGLGVGRSAREVLPFGCVVAVVNLATCVEITEQNIPGEPERSFGIYKPGRFAWHMTDVRILRDPVPCVGRQSLFELPADVVARVHAQLRAA